MQEILQEFFEDAVSWGWYHTYLHHDIDDEKSPVDDLSRLKSEVTSMADTVNDEDLEQWVF